MDSGEDCVICFLPVEGSQTLRSCACSSGRYHKNCILEWLIKYKCSCPICLRSGNSISLTARDFNDYNLNEELVKAVKKARPVLVRFLLSLSANPNQKLGSYPLLEYAFLNNHLDVCRRLLKDPRTKRQGALFLVVSRGLDVECLNILVSHGANVNGRDATGKTALMLAVEECHKVDMNLFVSGDTLVYSSEQMARALLRKGAKVNIRDNEKQTALMLASHNLTLVRLLTEHGASVNVKNIRGETALKYAGENTEVFEYLTSAGAMATKPKKRSSSFNLLWSKTIFTTTKRKLSITLYDSNRRSLVLRRHW